MQRYFFELRLGSRRVRDEDGEEFASPAEALRYGRLIAGELLQGHDVSGVVNAFVVVLDDDGAELGRIYLSDLSAVGSPLQRSKRVLH